MCGIFLIYSKSCIFTKEDVNVILKNFKKLKRRGPDQYSMTVVGNCLIGFQRLAINDTSKNGMQPFKLDETFTMCNGEIYNYHDLLSEHSYPVISKSDCEILPHLIKQYGVEETIKKLDGVFALSHFDYKNNKIYVCRDRVGIKPLFYAENDNFFAFSSEAKSLDNLGFNIEQLTPDTLLTYDINTHKTSFTSMVQGYSIKELNFSYEETKKGVHDLLVNSVHKRMISDREIGCLLSGGLDSSLVSSILAKEMKKQGKKLHTFSVGFPDSTDIVYARKVAEFIDSEHHEFIIQYDEALTRIEDVIYTTETFDTTSVRASTPMFLLCEWINKNFNEKVIFSGEGSDELFCGYLYFHNAPSPMDAHLDTIRLVKQLYKYDVLRADRCTSGNGLEFREPFLDKELVDFVLSMNPKFKIPMKKGDHQFEKYILREAFPGYLPEDVLWRRKAAFSDAVSSSVKPWYKWIQEYVQDKKVDDFGGTTENNYYRTIFNKLFSDYKPEIPLWLPNWSDVGQEPSATVLNVYNKEEH